MSKRALLLAAPAHVDHSERRTLEIAVGKLLEENEEEWVRISLSMYIGEKCLFCEREYKTLADLKNTLWVGQNENRRLACLGCWQKYGQNA